MCSHKAMLALLRVVGLSVEMFTNICIMADLLRARRIFQPGVINWLQRIYRKQRGFVYNFVFPVTNNKVSILYI